MQASDRTQDDGDSRRLSPEDRIRYDALRASNVGICSEFVRDHYALLFGWLARLTGDRNDAADLTQDAFAAFWGSLQRDTPGVDPRTWLFAIARNCWRKHCRSRASLKEQVADLEQVAEEISACWTSAGTSEFEQAVESALARLPDDFREVFTLRAWHEFDFAQIGAIQGITADLARGRYFRARKLLQARLQSWAVEDGR